MKDDAKKGGENTSRVTNDATNDSTSATTSTNGAMNKPSVTYIFSALV